MAKILNKDQAEAVYSAMVALNNVWAQVHVRIKLDKHAYLHVREQHEGHVDVFIGDQTGKHRSGTSERHDDQDAFSSAYGLSTGA
ncbi:hypothetical protein [Paraburkholderia adhaesiva]|uniref:hypothetical protein n=1 Tax=Paraburkholderia adhaesiva TaxID=2883244 RepID=UPI001F30AD25|nr:hypothetical protein [Paraburkholderia adhaesiva]